MIDAERGVDLPPDAPLRESDRVRPDDLRADAHAEPAEDAVVVELRESRLRHAVLRGELPHVRRLREIARGAARGGISSASGSSPYRSRPRARPSPDRGTRRRRASASSPSPGPRRRRACRRRRAASASCAQTAGISIPAARAASSTVVPAPAVRFFPFRTNFICISPAPCRP